MYKSSSLSDFKTILFHVADELEMRDYLTFLFCGCDLNVVCWQRGKKANVVFVVQEENVLSLVVFLFETFHLFLNLLFHAICNT